jgi:hypothetical protein
MLKCSRRRCITRGTRSSTKREEQCSVERVKKPVKTGVSAVKKKNHEIVSVLLILPIMPRQEEQKK